MKFILKLKKEIRCSVHGLSKIHAGHNHSTGTHTERNEAEVNKPFMFGNVSSSVSAQRVDTESVMRWLGLAVDTESVMSWLGPAARC